MGFLKTPGQTVGSFGNSYKVNVVVHQAVRPNLNTCGLRVTADEIKVCLAVFIREEDGLVTIAALSYVMGKIGCDDSGDSCHDGRLADALKKSIKYCVPGIQGG